MVGFARPAELDHQPKEDSTAKKPAKPRPIEARTVRPHMVGFACPAGPDHGPKEDSTVKKKQERLNCDSPCFVCFPEFGRLYNNLPQCLQNGLLVIAAQGVELGRGAMTDKGVADT